ncbi:MAG: MarR family winged helix-turn-helix transcriptional regulator [Oscillospiraceae bacterium]
MERSEKEKILFGLLTAISNRLDTFSINCLNELTLKQFFLIQYIFFIKDTCKEKGTPYIKEIAQVSGTTRQNVKSMVNILNKKGYLTVEKSKIDSRALCVSLTQKSLDFITNNSNISNNFLDLMFKDINQNDLDTTIRVLSKFINFLEGDGNV